MSVAQTILNQLGANKFIAMTGAKEFIAGDNHLRMKLPKNKSGATYLKISLNSKDLYDLEFFNIRKFEVVVKKQQNDIYADMLTSVFEQTTGMYTSL